MPITTNAIVLTHFKQGERGIICHVYSEQEGFLSFWAKTKEGKRKNRSVYHPLNQVELVYQPKANPHSLQFFTSIETKHHYSTLYEHPIKTAIVFFLTEIFYTCLIKDRHQNTHLFEVLSNSLIVFDKKTDHFSEFHLYLLAKMIQQMGVSPDLTHADFPYFDLQNGKFCLTIEKSSQLLTESEKQLFLKIFELDFSIDSKNQLSSIERKNAIHLLMRYLKLHIDNFKPPSSLEVLRQL